MEKMSIKKQLEWLLRGVSECISEEWLQEKLALNRPLVIKAGSIQLNQFALETVLLNKLCQFQLLGHQVVFLLVISRP